MWSKLKIIITNIKNKIDNSSIFYTVGLFLPFSLFLYRSVSILQNKVYTFNIDFGPFVSWNVWGVILFCYIPALLFFFFLLFFENFTIFVRKLLLKCNILFLTYCGMARIELVQIEDLYLSSQKKRNFALHFVRYFIFI